MSGDMCRATAGRARRPERRKKRKPKKRPEAAAVPGISSVLAAAPSLEVSRVCTETAPAAILSPESRSTERDSNSGSESTPKSVGFSPRKQALLRHKAGGAPAAEPLFVSEVKAQKRNRRQQPVAQSGATPGDALDGRYSKMLASQPMEEKTLLFTAPLARIVLYHEKVNDSPLRASPGTLLAHGEFEVFQLHGGDVTYLACGKSFVYPLLPKLKILRTSNCEFVLPLVNPQRYWKINIDSTDDSIFCRLETVLQRIVQYTSLASANGVQAPHAATLVDEISPRSVTPVEDAAHYTPYFNDIPESPPSMLASPKSARACRETLAFLVLPPQPRKVLDSQLRAWGPVGTNSLTVASDMASFPIGAALDLQATKISHPRPGTLANPFFRDLAISPASQSGGGIRRENARSETSSMDSLLDEYEEAISVTRSTHHNRSRPDSRATSHVSAVRSTAQSAAFQSHRQAVCLEFNARSTHHQLPAGISQTEALPTVSLSKYDKARQNSHDGRSRQSSISELYLTTSSWMEPGIALRPTKLAGSRSMYSLGSHLKGTNSNLNDTYREIYRLIILHEKDPVTGNSGAATAPVAMRSGTPNSNVHRTGQTASAGIERLYTGRCLMNPSNEHQRSSDSTRDAQPQRNDGLSSVEVFRLLSERGNDKQPPATGIRKLFGW